MQTLRFDVFGHFTLEVVREGNAWKAFRIGDGKRRPIRDLVIPSGMHESELLIYLGDFYHEFASPESEVRKIADR